jgi:hypothetical protein
VSHSIGAQKVKSRFVRRFIESIQPVSITIAAGDTDQTATINAVDFTRSLFVPGGSRGGDGSFSFNEDAVRVDLTDPTTVTAQTDTANAGSSRITAGTVIEFSPWAAKRTQTGSITIAANSTSNTATLQPYDMSRSVLVNLGTTGPASGLEFAKTYTRLSKTDPTTITATRGGNDAANAVTVNYALVELTPNVVRSAQDVSVTIASGGSAASGTATINRVSVGDTFLLPGGFTVNTSTANDIRLLPWLELTDPTTVTAGRELTSATTTTGNVTVIECHRGILRRVQRLVDAIGASATTQDSTITQVDRKRAFVTFLGFGRNQLASNMNIAYPTVELTSATNVRSTRANSNVIGVGHISWEVPEFWL